MTDSTPLIGIIMGSQSDASIMGEAAAVLDSLAVPYEWEVVSAHRTPQKMFDYAQSAAERGLRVIVAGAGGAAHLPGMVASLTTLPVVGVPIKSRNSLDGWDSLLSIAQMPAGVPVATVAVDGAANAGWLAAKILSTDPAQKSLQAALEDHKEALRQKVEKGSQEFVSSRKK